jgi:NAD(P)-dependent dehydrogenase (short-subunit alcohol dehydrogenase family)
MSSRANSDLRFDGRVAIVTGAGADPGLGRAYALLLAERGAKVVVNDLGVGPDGRGIQPVRAEHVVDEVRRRGGVAVADCNSVATCASAEAVVRTALEAWGRVDILVNNAGVNIPALFAEIDERDLQRTLDVHLFGTVWMCHAVWPHMCSGGYGRIVNISSGVALGLRRLVAYGAAKAGVLGLTRGLAIEGADHGIRVNSLAPGAGTASAMYVSDPANAAYLEEFLRLTPEQVAPTLAFLAHESCTLSGRHFNSVGGRVSELYLSETAQVPGLLSPEGVRDAVPAIIDRTTGTEVPDPITADAGNEWRPRTYSPPQPEASF